MTKCPECGYTTTETIKYCEKCGIKIESTAEQFTNKYNRLFPVEIEDHDEDRCSTDLNHVACSLIPSLIKPKKLPKKKEVKKYIKLVDSMKANNFYVLGKSEPNIEWMDKSLIKDKPRKLTRAQKKMVRKMHGKGRFISMDDNILYQTEGNIVYEINFEENKKSPYPKPRTRYKKA